MRRRRASSGVLRKGDPVNIIRRTGIVGVCLLSGVAARWASADVVTDWDNVLIDAIRVSGGGPGPIAREGALMHVAIYDAVNSIDHGYQTMHTNAPPGTLRTRIGINLSLTPQRYAMQVLEIEHIILFH